jgi:hypothetical protein
MLFFAAPMKNKKEILLGHRFYKQVTPSGVWARTAKLSWHCFSLPRRDPWCSEDGRTSQQTASASTDYFNYSELLPSPL